MPHGGHGCRPTGLSWKRWTALHNEALAVSYAEWDSRAMTGDLEISAGRPGDAATIPTATRQTTLGKRRVVVEPADVAARTVGTTPISAEFERPPFSPVAQIHGLLGRGKDPSEPALSMCGKAPE